MHVIETHYRLCSLMGVGLFWEYIGESESLLWDQTSREPRKAALPGLGIGRTIVAMGLVEANWMIVLSSRHKLNSRSFEFSLLSFHHLCLPVALCLAAESSSFVYCYLLAAHSSTPVSLSVENPCPVSHYYKWWFLCLIVSVSSQLQLSHGPSAASWPPSLCTVPDCLTTVGSL